MMNSLFTTLISNVNDLFYSVGEINSYLIHSNRSALFKHIKTKHKVSTCYHLLKLLSLLVSIRWMTYYAKAATTRWPVWGNNWVVLKKKAGLHSFKQGNSLLCVEHQHHGRKRPVSGTFKSDGSSDAPLQFWD